MKPSVTKHCLYARRIATIVFVFVTNLVELSNKFDVKMRLQPDKPAGEPIALSHKNVNYLRRNFSDFTCNCAMLDICVVSKIESASDKKIKLTREN